MSDAGSPSDLPLLSKGPTHIRAGVRTSSRSPEAVFRDRTEPGRRRLWPAPEPRFDARKGGAHDISWPRMNRHLRGRFDRFDPRRVLAFSAWWEHEPEFTKRAGVSFRAFEESTTVMVEHGEYSELSRDPESRQEHLDGWVHFLGRLAAIPPSHGRE